MVIFEKSRQPEIHRQKNRKQSIKKSSIFSHPQFPKMNPAARDNRDISDGESESLLQELSDCEGESMVNNNESLD